METALNVLWDSGAAAGDRITVIGAGVLGVLVAYLAARLPGTDVTLSDVNAHRAAQAAAVGCAFAAPDDAPVDCDVVIHASASDAGLARALDCAADDATVVEASWHGTGRTAVPLGGAFHSRRLRLVHVEAHLPVGMRERPDVVVGEIGGDARPLRRDPDRS
jgi:threonine dehydrogenase-like Zn-dependent dehydrogenase